MHLKKGVVQNLTRMKHKLDIERHPTLLRCNDTRIRVTSGTFVQIHAHCITK
jgi:hypothetical protein